MTRKTSIETFRQIEEEGMLSSRRLQVYSTLFKIGPATAAEISEADRGSFTNPAKGDNSHARLSELKKMGCVEEVGERVCSITGRNVLVFDVTSDLPQKFEKEPSKLDSVIKQYNDLWDAVETLCRKPIRAQEKGKELVLILKRFDRINDRAKSKL
jgi:hypothetical protein